MAKKRGSSTDTILKANRAYYWWKKGKSLDDISAKLYGEGLRNNVTGKALSIGRIRELIKGFNWYSKSQLWVKIK